MQAEHQVVEKGVFFILAIKSNRRLGARCGKQSKVYLSVRTAGRSKFRRTPWVKLNTRLHVWDHLLQSEVHTGILWKPIQESRRCYKHTQLHCRCSKILAPQQPCCCPQPFISVCSVLLSLMRNRDMNYSPWCIHSLHSLPAGQTNLGRQYLRWTLMWRNRGSIHTGARWMLRLVHSREGADSIPSRESEEQPQHFIYWTFPCLTLNWIFSESASPSLGVKVGNILLRNADKEKPRDISASLVGFSRLQQNFSFPSYPYL